MRKVIEEIISNGECHVIFSEGRIEFTDETISNMADKILSLFEKKIDECMKDIIIKILEFGIMTYEKDLSTGNYEQDIAQHIINIIKSKVKE